MSPLVAVAGPSGFFKETSIKVQLSGEDGPVFLSLSDAAALATSLMCAVLEGMKLTAGETP